MTQQTDSRSSNSADADAHRMTGPMLRPWYREPWPWLLSAIPFATVVASGFTLSMAMSTEDGLVAADYYKRGIAINRDLARERAADRLGASVRLHFSPGEGRVVAALPPEAPHPAALLLRLTHPTRSGQDIAVRLEAISADTYAGALRLIPVSHWRVMVEDPEGVWRLTGTWETSSPDIALQAGKAPE